jgi:hypothetical protein
LAEDARRSFRGNPRRLNSFLSASLTNNTPHPDSSISSNFYIEEHLTAGTTVYLRVTLKQATTSGSFTLYVDAE